MSRESKPQNSANRFIKAARALEWDEDEARFNEALGKIAKQKLTDKPPEPEPENSSSPAA